MNTKNTTPIIPIAISGLAITALALGLVVTSSTVVSAHHNSTESKNSGFFGMHNKNDSKINTELEEEIKKSLQNNSYEEFKSIKNNPLLTRITSQAEFDDLVAQYTARLDHHNKIIEAIKNNDYESYKTVISSRSSTKHTPPTEEQIKSRFDTLVKDYQNNGSLPDFRFHSGGRRGMRR